MHISSNVEGVLADGLDALDALIGVSGGHAVGCAEGPGAMEIIEELEPDRRAIYAGCIGYFAANVRTVDITCIGLRTASGEGRHSRMYVQAGAGIVADLRSGVGVRGVPVTEGARAESRPPRKAVRFCGGERWRQ